jgi:hypothetical protein
MKIRKVNIEDIEEVDNLSGKLKGYLSKFDDYYGLRSSAEDKHINRFKDAIT